jgi:protein TonB
MIVRYISALTSGTFMTLALFYVMQSLISMVPLVPDEPRPPWILDFAPLIEDSPVELDAPPPKRPAPLVEPTPPISNPEYSGPQIGVTMTSPTPPGPIGTFAAFNADGPLVAMVRVEPVYPARASEKGLNGFVTVRFDVNPDGTVSNVAVVESTHRVFEKAAVNAAKKFRYKARVVDGIPQTTSGVQSRFVFEMERG